MRSGVLFLPVCTEARWKLQTQQDRPRRNGLAAQKDRFSGEQNQRI